eukprot:TRINITY_DN1440_c0_g1_i1.p1 TRINITY_DN1440_c0_g1~~TRINITY_DN1440_c0_g1_i1.p1  ORF type:complete len:237 (+),score=83.98 TRINITY_DN1440_c0_g1_i1:35-712(+)
MKASMQRLVEKAHQKIEGSGKASADTEYDEQYARISFLGSTTNALSKDIKRYLDSVQALQQATQKLAEDMLQLWDPDTALRSAAEGFVEGAQAVEAKRLAQTEVIQHESLDPLAKTLVTFVEFKRKDEERKKLLLDYEVYKRKMESLQAKPQDDPSRIPRNEQKLKLAQDHFEHQHGQLKGELFQFWNQRYEVVEPPLKQFLAAHIALMEANNSAYAPMAASLGI